MSSESLPPLPDIEDGAGPLFTKSRVIGEGEGDDDKDELDAGLYVDRHRHFAIPSQDGCTGCPKSSDGTYDEFGKRCMEAARRVISAHTDKRAINSKTGKAVVLKDVPACVKAGDSRRMAYKVMHRPDDGSYVVLKTTIEVVENPVPSGLNMTKEELIRAHNFAFVQQVDPANEPPVKGRKKRPLVEMNHTFDTQGGHGIGKHHGQ